MQEPIPEAFAEFRQYVIDDANESELLSYLTRYTEPGAYTGAHFHELAYVGPHSPNRIDVADIASLSLLSVTVSGRMAQELLRRSEASNAIEEALAREPDRDLACLTSDEVSELESESGLNPAWHAIKQIDGFGPTRTSKLLSRKRPRLIPIWDSVIGEVLGLPRTGKLWTHFHTALTMENGALDERLAALARASNLEGRFSRLRILDILAWMYGKDKRSLTAVTLTEKDVEEG